MKFYDGNVDIVIVECDMEIYGTKKLKVKALGKSSRKVSVPALDYAMEGKKQDIKKVENKMQIVIEVEAKQSRIAEEKQRATKPNKNGQFPLDTDITMCQTDLKVLGGRTSWLNNNILSIGMKQIAPHTP